MGWSIFKLKINKCIKCKTVGFVSKWRDNQYRVVCRCAHTMTGSYNSKRRAIRGFNKQNNIKG